MSTNKKRGYVDAICIRCGKPFMAQKSRIKIGMGKFCSRLCSSLSKTDGKEKKYIGKKNGKTAFDKIKQSYYVYWFDEETQERKTTSYARWWWETNRGEIPDGYRASYKDGNSLNISPENIILISPQEFGNRISQRLMGHSFSSETLQKMSDAKRGRKLSDEHKAKIGDATKQMWERGVFDNPRIRKVYSEQGKATKGSKRTDEQRERMSEMRKKNPVILQMFTKDASEKRRQKLIGRKQSAESNLKRSRKLKNRVFTEQHLFQLSEAGKKRRDNHGKNSHWWKGGIANQPYPDEFSDYLKRRIRKRDNYTCQSCGIITYGSKTGHVHHMDGDKRNCARNNLILLCASCHNAVHDRNKLTNDKIQELKSMLK